MNLHFSIHCWKRFGPELLFDPKFFSLLNVGLYVATEIFKDEIFDKSVDVYSFGLLLYEVIFFILIILFDYGENYNASKYISLSITSPALLFYQIFLNLFEMIFLFQMVYSLMFALLCKRSMLIIQLSLVRNSIIYFKNVMENLCIPLQKITHRSIFPPHFTPLDPS